MSVYEKVVSYIKTYPGGIAWRVKKHSKIIEEHLNPGEEIIFIFCGQKALNLLDIFSTCIVTITNKRLLVAQKRLFWGYRLISITPDMYNDLTVYSGILWGRVTIDTVKELIHVSKLSKKALDTIETEITEYMIKEKQKYKTNEDET